MYTAKTAIIPGVIGALAVVAVLLADPGSVPPSSPMVAALVAAALCSFRQTVGFATVGLVVCALLTRFVSDYTGSALWSRIAFQVALGTIAVVVAWTPLRRRALSEQSLPILHDVSNELFDTHGMDELGAAVTRLAGPLNTSTTLLFVREDDQLVMLPREVEPQHALLQPGTRSACPGRLLDLAIDRGRSVFWPSAAAVIADAPDCADWAAAYRVRSLVVDRRTTMPDSKNGA